MAVEKDQDFEQAVQKELARRRRRKKLLSLFLVLIAVGSIGYFASYTYMEQKTQKSSSEWAQLKEKSKKKTVSKKEETNKEIVVNKTEAIQAPDVLPEYEILLNKNKSLIGWVKIADTNIDYPVMQTENNEYYLDHNFEQQHDKNGCIFMDASCDVVNRSTNLIVYGHHMKSGAMFGQLEKYADKAFYESHQTFEFDTIYEKANYRVAYVFRSQVFDEDEIVFKYYQFINANSETEFKSYMLEMANMSLYDTGITPAYGDELVTLSTCDHSEVNDGRFVVVGVKITGE